MSTGDLYQSITGVAPTAEQIRRMERIKTNLALSSDDALLAMIVVQDFYLLTQAELVGKTHKTTTTMVERLDARLDERLSQFRIELLAHLDGKVVIDEWILGFSCLTVTISLATELFMLKH